MLLTAILFLLWISYLAYLFFWMITEIMHRKKTTTEKHPFSVAVTVQKIDSPSILFFMAILLAVAAMQTNGFLKVVGNGMDNAFADFHVVGTLLGLLSSIVDNVPLVAGAMGMYSMELYLQDHQFWTFLAGLTIFNWTQS